MSKRTISRLLDDALKRQGADARDEDGMSDGAIANAAYGARANASDEHDFVNRSATKDGEGRKKQTTTNRRGRGQEREQHDDGGDADGVMGRKASDRVGERGSASRELQLPGVAIGARARGSLGATGERGELWRGDRGDGGEDVEGWGELCAQRFADKKEARLAALEWYSKSSSSSARLIVDKWRESKVRYVLRCQTAMPKRSEKSNKVVCQTKGSMCAMCVHIKFDRESQDWGVSRQESVPSHDSESCADSLRPNVSSVQFAQALEGIADVPAVERNSFVARRLMETGYRISSGTKQRAICLALGLSPADSPHRGSLGK